MTIQDFITKAIEGGWKTEHPYEPNTQGFRDELNRALLDSLAWQAVGRTEGWPPWESWDGPIPRDKGIPMWHAKMLYMVDALAHGGTLEAYLETL